MEALNLDQASILVVDDNASNVLLVEEILDEAGFTDVRSTTDPEAVVNLVSERRPSLILLDIHMPVMDGFAVMEALQRANPGKEPLIMILTAHSDIEIRTRALAMGAIDFLTKPLDQAEVLQRIRNLLRFEQRSSRHPVIQQDLLDLLEREKDPAESLALADPVSLLPNRRAVMLNLLKRIARRQTISTFYIELEGVEQISRTFGYEIAERTVRNIAQGLERSALATLCDFGHWAGYHLVAVGGGLSDTETEQLAQRISSFISGDHVVDTLSVYVKGRVGYNFTSDSLNQGEELIRRAALATPDQTSMIPYAGYDNHLDTIISREVLIQRELLHALQKNQLELVYQPKLRMKDQRMIGCEALARWTHEILGPISPGEFVPVAERSGAIEKLGNWVLDAGLAQLARWFQSGKVGADFVMALNVSAAQMMRPGFSDAVRRMLDKHSLSGYQVQLEITESMLIENVQHTISELAELRELGITIAMDDFGTGYSSLSYLKELPLDVLKIDRSFTVNLTEDHKDQRLIQSVIAIAHTFNLRVVAEGIETEEQARLLKTMNCDIAQGYFYSKPLSVRDFPTQPMIASKADEQSEPELSDLLGRHRVG